MTRLVQRWGRTGFALAASLMWALPMAVWAGSFDLGPPRAWPWVFLWVGLVLLGGWVLLVAWAARVPVVAPARVRRFDVAAMSPGERRWYGVLFVCGTGLIGWLNAAATVDGAALVRAAAAGRPGAALLLVGLAALAVLLTAGTLLAWRRASGAFVLRAGR